MADHTDPISAPPVDPDIVEPAPWALHARPWAIAAVAAGVVMFHRVSRDFQLNRGCQILRRLHHFTPASNDPIDSTPPLLGRDGQCGRHPADHRHRRSGGSGGGRAVRRTP